MEKSGQDDSFCIWVAASLSTISLPAGLDVSEPSSLAPRNLYFCCRLEIDKGYVYTDCEHTELGEN